MQSSTGDEVTGASCTHAGEVLEPVRVTTWARPKSTFPRVPSQRRGTEPLKSWGTLSGSRSTRGTGGWSVRGYSEEMCVAFTRMRGRECSSVYIPDTQTRDTRPGLQIPVPVPVRSRT